jgi:hypothetical protein
MTALSSIWRLQSYWNGEGTRKEHENMLDLWYFECDWWEFGSFRQRFATGPESDVRGLIRSGSSQNCKKHYFHTSLHSHNDCECVESDISFTRNITKSELGLKSLSCADFSPIFSCWRSPPGFPNPLEILPPDVGYLSELEVL